jgi:hypothetical protein
MSNGPAFERKTSRPARSIRLFRMAPTLTRRDLIRMDHSREPACHKIVEEEPCDTAMPTDGGYFGQSTET